MFEYSRNFFILNGSRGASPRGFRVQLHMGEMTAAPQSGVTRNDKDMWNGSPVTEMRELQRDLQRGHRVLDVIVPSLRYIFATEVHAYAFSIAANAYLSFFPFTLILLAVCRHWLHWEGAYQLVLQLLRIHLPAGAESVIRNLSVLVEGRPRLQMVSVFMLFFTCSGVFLPLEVALNKVWRFTRNRSFLKNQMMSFVLASVCGVLAFGYVFVATGLQWMITSSLGWVPSKTLVTLVSRPVLEFASIPLVISTYLLIYYILPNGQVPLSRVLPAAIVTGVLTEAGKFIYVQTLPMFRFREVYGPYAFSVTLLFWAYVGALILLFGAHLSARGFVRAEAPVAVPAAEVPEPAAVPSVSGRI